MPNETLNEMHADNDSPVEMPVSESCSVQLHAGGAAPAIEMPSPSPTMKKACCIKDHSRSCTTGDFAGAGDRLHSSASTGNGGVALMISHAKKSGESSEIQTVGSGFTVMIKPLGTCRKELSRHRPMRSTTSPRSPIVVNIECDARRDSQPEE